ncbi:Ras-GAP domain-containing protein [Entamoeba marina]
MAVVHSTLFVPLSPRLSTPSSPASTSPITIKKEKKTKPSAKKSQEQSLAELLFDKSNHLLFAYCDALLKNDPDPQHITVLIDYYQSRGKLTDLLTTLACREISMTKGTTPLFRGNTTFTRVYSYYVRRHCSSLLQSTSSIIIVNENQTPSSDILSIYAKTLLKSLPELPPHLHSALQIISSKVHEFRGEVAAMRAVATLLFLRFLFIPLIRLPDILKKLQSGVHDALEGNCDEISGDVTFSRAVHIIVEHVMEGPCGVGVSVVGVSSARREASLRGIIEIIKTEMRKISGKYNDDFEEVFNVVKGKVDGCVINVDFATSELTSWMDEREGIVERENKELIICIERLKKKNRDLRALICKFNAC